MINQLLKKKYIFYNPYVFKKIQKLKNIPYFNDDIVKLRDNICKIDLTKNINYSFVKVLYSFDIKKENKSFLELCFSKYNNLKHHKKRIFYSGGVDSSLIVLLSLYLNDIKNVEIFLTEKSIKDFPIFFEKIIKKEFEYIIFEYSKLKNYFIPNYYNIIGDGAEEICGWNGILNLHCIYSHNYDYHKYKISHLKKNNEFDRYWLNLYEFGIKNNLFLNCPILETIEDLTICLISNLHWQYVKLRFPIPFYNNLKEIINFSIPFYADENFRNFALYNTDKMNGKNYFYESKQIIKDSIITLFSELKDEIKWKPRGTNVSYKNYVPLGYIGYDENFELIKIPKHLKHFLDLSKEEQLKYKYYENLMLSD